MNNVSDKIKNSVFLINDGRLFGSLNYPVQSGWDIDKRSHKYPEGISASGLVLATTPDSKYDVFMKRSFLRQTSGKVSFYHFFEIFYGESFHVSVLDSISSETSFELSSNDGFFTVNGEKTTVKAEAGKHFFEAEADLDNGTLSVYIDNTNCGSFKLFTKAVDLVKILLDKNTETAFSPLSFHAWINYSFIQKYFIVKRLPLCDKWEFSCDDGECYEENDINIVCGSGSTAKLGRKADKPLKAAELEIKYLAEKPDGMLCISLMCGDKTVSYICDDGKTASSDGIALRNHSENVWQTLRLLADTESGSAKVFINGKDCGFIKCEEAEYIDGISVTYSHENGGKLRLCDISLSELYDLPEDYVTPPVLPEKKDYIVGINTCSLWRNGNHIGWDTITPFEENKPLLGYYDEGIPEQSDWEIKWMSEHGIDFEFFCWFNSGDRTPIKRTAHSMALVDGYMNARYKDNLKFAIIWEAVGGSPSSISDYREKILPYWMDYFFSDKNYMTLDNKVLIAIYGAGSLVRDFGSAEEVKKQFKYTNEKVKELGYEGAVFISCGRPTELLKQCGFDAVYAYNWNERGCCPDYTKTMITAQRETGILHVIPTVSTGFNGVAWNHRRAELLTCENMGSLFTWIKDDVLPQSQGESWQNKLVMLSTWNEFGEGTYICPANLNGFGYLDEIRKAFTYDSEHSDDIPTENQKSRVCYIYPQNRSILKPLQKYTRTYPDKVVGSIELSTKTVTSTSGTHLAFHGGILHGVSHDLDPQIYIENLNIAADSVQNIRIRMRGSTVNGLPESVVLYFKTEENDSWAESRGTKSVTSPDVISDCNLYVGELDTWCGKITGIRIDPISSYGTFDIESITLLADDKSLTLNVNGEKVKTAVEIQEIDGTVYLPFEQYREYGKLRFYSEWHKENGTLYLVYEDKHMYFTVGRDTFTVNGNEKKLSAPVFVCDGLPMLDIKALCGAIDLIYNRDDRKIYICE